MSGTTTSRHFMERRTATHVYFLTGPGSMWYPGTFLQSIAPDLPPTRFNCREQYVVARQRHVGGDPDGVAAAMAAGPDEAAMAEILALRETDPREALRLFQPFAREQKRIGRTPPPDARAWEADRPSAAYAANVAAFGQDPAMLGWLLGTGERVLVEGSDRDEVWGAGLRWDDPRILDARNWTGGNLLGRTLGLARSFHRRHACLPPADAVRAAG